MRSAPPDAGRRSGTAWRARATAWRSCSAWGRSARPAAESAMPCLPRSKSLTLSESSRARMRAVAAGGLPGVRHRRLPELLDRGGGRHLLPLVRHLRRADPRGLRRGIVEHMGRTFRQLLTTEPYLFTGGVYDPLGAQLAERAGMRSVYLSGYSMAMAQGWPDMGFLTQTEVTRIASMVASAVSIPIIADADDGYGNALSTIRTVQEYVKTGVAGIHLEDQRFPKRCGHIAGKTVVDLDEALGKYRAAVDTRNRLDPDFVIIARTDAYGAVGGSLEAAIRRGRAY